MYIYVNTTEVALLENFTKLLELQERVRNGSGEKAERSAENEKTNKQKTAARNV